MHDIVHELTIDATPARVFQAVATAPGLAAWFATTVELEGGGGASTAEPAEGDVLVVGEPSADGDPAYRFRIDTLDPPEDDTPALAHLTCLGGPEEWPDTQIAFRIEAEDGEGTVLRFWHGGWEFEDGVLPRCSFQWAMDLDRLRRVLEA